MEILVKRQNPVMNRALVRLNSHNSIVLSAPALTQYLETRSLLSLSGNSEQSLPALTESIEFLERIRSLNPSIKQRAIRLYSLMKGIDQQHLYRIESIRFESTGGAQ